MPHSWHCRVSAKVGAGSRRGGLALGQARQEGGGGILRPLEDPAPANLGVSAKGGEGDEHPGHLSLRGLARRHLRSEEGPSCIATLWPGPRGAARPGQPQPAWPVAAARPGGSLRFGAGLRGLHGTKRKGLSPACEGPEWDQRSPFSLLPVPRIRRGGRMGARGGPIKPEEAQ